LKPDLILLTHDDGIESDALWAAAESLRPLGELLIVAPNRQWSGGGRSMPHGSTGRLLRVSRRVGGEDVSAYSVDASPAQTVVHALMEVADRPPALVVSGINYGANLGSEVTVSGTVGAALEAGAFGIPSLAISVEMDPIHQLAGDNPCDLSAAIAFTGRFARSLLGVTYPPDVDALNVNIPADATIDTPVRVARLSRRRYYLPRAAERSQMNNTHAFDQIADPQEAEPGSDVWSLKVEGNVTVTPLSLDLTARVDLGQFSTYMGAALLRPHMLQGLANG